MLSLTLCLEMREGKRKIRKRCHFLRLVVQEKRKVNKVVFGSCKIFSGNAIFGKGKYFQVFSCIPKNALENFF